MVAVPGGSFQMGSPSGGFDDERPVHTVTLTGFSIGKYEVTQAQYLSVTGVSPSFFNSGANAPTRPVEMVTWYDAVEFCNRLSEVDGFTPVYTITGRSPTSGYPITGATVTQDMTKNGYRLPTEAEWEYAARGGDGSPGNYNYAGSDDINAVAWWGYNAAGGGNAEETTHSVGTKYGNGLGLYDMTGNAVEWCQDWYDSGYYATSPSSDPAGASSGTFHPLRGGYWGDDADFCRSAIRNCTTPWFRYYGIGFRVVRRP
jgi:formylglycine-generating enzyme required for sulfatase activity